MMFKLSCQATLKAVVGGGGDSVMLNSIQTPLPLSHSPKMTLSLFLFLDKHTLSLALFFAVLLMPSF
jgi:hypothetical protein